MIIIKHLEIIRFFSASDRIKTIGNNSNPTYSCASKEDSFSVLNTNTGMVI